MTVASLVIEDGGSATYAQLFRPEPLPNGAELENRVVLCGVSWHRYLAFDQALGENRPAPRFYYLDEELEIVTTFKEHERIKLRLAALMAVYFEEVDLDYFEHGQATMRLTDQSVGVEPDMSWCVAEEKQFPDLVLEVALTSGGIRKLDLYRRFQIREVWIWRHDGLEICVLDSDGSNYVRVTSGSYLLAHLDVAL